MKGNSSERFFWYDLETTGTDSAKDRIMQFAGMFTDLEMNPIADPINCYIRIPDEVLPHPEACCVTRLDPWIIQSKGINELDLLSNLHENLLQGNTCICGFNNIQFDDNFLRFAFYRNLFPAYQHEYDRGNSRMDLLPILRFAASIRPNGITWPRINGESSFKLENLARSNGLDSTDAHDALADVRNTLGMARLLKEKQPRLWSFAYDHRHKREVAKLIQPKGQRIFLYVRHYRRDPQGYLGVGVAVTNTEYQNVILGVDLTADVSLLDSASVEELTELTFTPKSQREENNLPDSPVFRFQLNRSPVVSSFKALTADDAARLGISKNKVRRNLEYVQKVKNLGTTLRRIFDSNSRKAQNVETNSSTIAEEQLYSGEFVKNSDLTLGRRCHVALRESRPFNPDNLSWAEDRTRELASRLIVRNAPQTLDENQVQAYRRFVKQQLSDPDRGVDARLAQINESRMNSDNISSFHLLDKLETYIHTIRRKYDV